MTDTELETSRKRVQRGVELRTAIAEQKAKITKVRDSVAIMLIGSSYSHLLYGPFPEDKVRESFGWSAGIEQADIMAICTSTKATLILLLEKKLSALEAEYAKL